ncbi:MAG: GH3 auxin-responsive promoter family protein [Planctomycetes bacterium]|nr:GH3 auxin-responsive promoter family protein [Planctomycetota bacterium]
MSLAYWLNTAWMWSCRRESRAFHLATQSVAKTQHVVLRDIVSKNANSTFGRQHDFRSIRSVADLQQRVPLSTYAGYSTAIEQISAGRTNVLTVEPIELLEPTSGTTRGEKLIPYTASLRRQFQRAVAVWIADVMERRPQIRRGRAYWSISPALGPTRITSGGTPIGFDDDAAYLSRMERVFLKHLLVTPPEISRLSSIENFRYCTLFHLLAAADLTLLSVWSPTFLTSLLSRLDSWSDRLSDDLRGGRANLPDVNEPNVSECVLTTSCGKERAKRVGSILRSNEPLSTKLSRLWPRLDLISCWADSTAGTYMNGVRELFPNIAIQPKGLLSTEACVSFPLVDRPGAALALRSHFFEFIDVSDSKAQEETRLADQLRVGERYELVVTTGGGLYRYRTRDIVEVVGFENECPLLKFVGRAGRVSDLVGEKVNESHVSQILQQVCQTHVVTPEFAMLVPIASPAGYRLYLEASNNQHQRMTAMAASILHNVEVGLNQNPHYRYAVQLGQLQPLDMRIVDGNRLRLWEIYERILLARGQRAGDIKPTALDSWLGWDEEFDRASPASKHSFSPFAE